MRTQLYSIIVFIFCVSIFVPGRAATFDEGVQLYTDEKYAEALTIFRSLEAQGDINSAYAIGLMYTNGYGVEKDIAKASDYYAEAARGGHSAAQNWLGIILLQGMAGEKDFERSYELFKKSASQGNKYGNWNVARFVLEANPSYFTEERLISALSYAKRAEELGHGSAKSLVENLECLTNEDVPVVNNIFARESPARYEIRGDVRLVEYNGRTDSRIVDYFGKGGHLARTVFESGNEHRYTYDKDCNLLRWESRNYSDYSNRKYSISGFEEYTYSNGRLSSGADSILGGSDYKYYFTPQNDGGLVKTIEKVASEYPTVRYQKYDASGLLEWSTGNVPPTPSEFWEITTSGSTLSYLQVFNKGTSRMALKSGTQYLYTNNGNIRKVIDNSSPDGSYKSSVEYIYGHDGWIREEIFHGTDANESKIKRVKYSEYKLDGRGNWLSRWQGYAFDGNDMSNRQSRVIRYY